MKVGAADGAACDLDDGVVIVFQVGIRNCIAANIFASVPAECAHGVSFFLDDGDATEGSGIRFLRFG